MFKKYLVFLLNLFVLNLVIFTSHAFANRITAPTLPGLRCSAEARTDEYCERRRQEALTKGCIEQE